MPLAAGYNLGPYEILAATRADGMGEVYGARDSRLARDAVIKVSAAPTVVVGATQAGPIELEASTKLRRPPEKVCG